ncbi:MAG: hypothetical protein VW879_04305 [Opitutae bacterium]
MKFKLSQITEPGFFESLVSVQSIKKYLPQAFELSRFRREVLQSAKDYEATRLALIQTTEVPVTKDGKSLDLTTEQGQEFLKQEKSLLEKEIEFDIKIELVPEFAPSPLEIYHLEPMFKRNDK